MSLMKLKELINRIEPLNEEVGARVANYIDNLTKPIGSLGRLEELAIQLAKMTAEPFPQVSPAGVIIFAADHGITKEGVSAFPQEVTAQMVYNFLQGGAAINVFSRQIGAEFAIVDIGVASDLEQKGYIDRKIRYGTANFLNENAMEIDEAVEALLAGADVAEEMINRGAKCLILGEMGIGNTTTSSTLLAALSGKEVDSLVGKGTGLDEEQRLHKINVIRQSLQNRMPDASDPLDLLSKVGGLEIAGMAGAMLACASRRIPILVDGFICTVASLIATQFHAEVQNYMIVGHLSQEPGHQLALELLGKKPLLQLDLRLGEGSGAAIAFPLLESSTRMVKEMATFSSAGVSNKS